MGSIRSGHVGNGWRKLWVRLNIWRSELRVDYKIKLSILNHNLERQQNRAMHVGWERVERDLIKSDWIKGVCLEEIEQF